MRRLPIGAFTLCACTVCPKDWEAHDGECVQREPWPAACPEEVGALSTEGELFAGPLNLYPSDTYVIEDQAALDEFLASMEFPPDLPPVDFGSSYVLGASRSLGTCGAVMLGHGLTDSDALVLQIGDRSGTCRDRCDMSLTFVVLYEVPLPASDPTACVEVVGTCRSGY